MNNFVLENILIKDLVQSNYLTCSSDETLLNAAAMMTERRCSTILVEQNKEIIGIWTERDALKHNFRTPNSGEQPISLEMSSPVISLNGNLSLEEFSCQFKKYKALHYIVTDNSGNRLGVISHTDIIREHNLALLLLSKSTASVTRTNYPRVSSKTCLSEAAHLMHDSLADALVVEFPKGNIGLLTERGVLTALASAAINPTVADFVSEPMLIVLENDSLFNVRKVMLKNNASHVGVVDSNKNLLGVINVTDLLTGCFSPYVERLETSLENSNASLKSTLKSLQLTQKIIENSSSGILITDTNSKILTCNTGFTNITGYTENEVLGKNPSIISSGRHDKDFYTTMWREIIREDYWQGEIWNRRKNGEVYPELLTIIVIRDSDTHKIINYAAIFSDISQNKRNVEEIKQLTFYDPLTKLPNRRLLTDRMGQEIARAIRTKKKGALLFIGLDNFRHINDSLGYTVGDVVLQEVANRIKKLTRECDTVARLGSDQFVIILSKLNQSIESACHTAQQITKKLQQSICKTYSIEDQNCYISSSIGINIFTENGGMPDDLIKQANTAMCRAKDKGRNNIQFFHPNMQETAIARMILEKGLREALQKNHFSLYYQPQIDRMGKIAGAEALLRWNHPEQGFISPAKFIPVAEQCGLIIEIGDWVLKQAFIHLLQWQKQHIKLPHLAINISPRQFYQNDFIEKLNFLVDQYQIDPGRIMLEITEGLLMNDVEAAIEKMQVLKKAGFSFSIDDFGTGYSSLSYLKHLPINQLKIDKVFVEDITNDQGDAILVDTIIAMAKHMKLDIVAEGVEVEEELAFLENSGCHCYQGYYFSRPLPYDQFIDYCKKLNCMPDQSFN